MNQVKNLDFEYIVATDLAARGIDIEGVSHVINDAIPQDLSFFVHRVGRTGRNGLPGVAITLYQPSDDSDIRELEKMGIRFVPVSYTHLFFWATKHLTLISWISIQVV